MTGASSNKNLVLAAMVFAVAMTFIDQTIVAIAVPDLEKDLSLSETGAQWIINGYLLSLSALFAFGGKPIDQQREVEWSRLLSRPRARAITLESIKQSSRNQEPETDQRLLVCF